jgi:hypothetical protein
MWGRLRDRIRVWLGLAASSGEPFPEPECIDVSPEPPRPEAIERAEARTAIDAQDWAGALRAVGDQLEGNRATAGDMGLAAVALNALGLAVLARGFEAVAQGPTTENTSALAGDLLTHGDPAMALAVTRFGAGQISGDAPSLAGIAGEALARLGRHEEALHVLEGYVCRWPDPALLRRYVLSALMTQNASCLELAEKDLKETHELRWLVSALDRHGAAAPETPESRRGYLVAYGGLLLSDDALPSAVPPSQVAMVVERLALALEALGAVPDRITSFSAQGDCLARWIARRLGVMSIPLTARIDGQSVLGVAVDADEGESLRAHERWDGANGVIFQWSHEAGRPMGRPPAILGGFGSECALPFEGLEAVLGADRTPHSTAFEAAYQRSGAGAVVDVPASWPAWVQAHRELFTVSSDSGTTTPYLGDVPAPGPAISDEVCVTKGEADAPEVATPDGQAIVAVEPSAAPPSEPNQTDQPELPL